MQHGILQFLAPVRRRWWLVAIIVIPVCLVTAAYSIISPAEFDGMIRVKERSSDPELVTQVYPSMVPGDPERRVQDVFQTINSKDVLYKTLDDVVKNGIWHPKGVDTDAQFEEFMNRFNVEPERGSDLVEIHFRAPSQDEAIKVVSHFFSKLQDQWKHMDADAGKDQVQFIEQQLEDAQRRFKQAAEKRSKYLATHDAIDTHDSTGALVQLKTEATTRRNEAARQEQAMASSLRDYQREAREAARMPMRKEQVTTIMNPVYERAMTDLAQAQTNMAAFGQTMGPNHPKMGELLKQRDTLQNLVDSLRKEDKAYIQGGKTEARNSLWDLAQKNVDAVTAELSGTRAARMQADKQLADVNTKIAALPHKERDEAVLNADMAASQTDVMKLKDKLTEARVKASEAGNRTQLTQVDMFAPPIPKKTWIKVLIALGLSLTLSVGLVLVLGQFDSGTYDANQTENALGFPVIGSLPRTKQAELPKTIDTPTPLSASYQMLSATLLETQNRMQGPALLVASAEPNTGRSSVAANLAVSLARDGARVVLVDADLREPALHHHFDVENRSGLTDILTGAASVEDVAMPTPVDGLLIITSGKPPTNPVRLLRSEELERFIEQVSKAADFVVFDSPAGSTFADADVLARVVQNVLLVHQAGSPATQSEVDFHKRLERLGVNIVGIALNKVRPEDSHGYTNFRRAYEASILGREVVGTTSHRALGQGRSVTPKQPRPSRTAAPPTIEPIVEDEDEE